MTYNYLKSHFSEVVSLGFAASVLGTLMAPKAYNYFYPDYTAAFHREVSNANTKKALEVFLSSPAHKSAINYISDSEINKGLYWFCDYSTQEGSHIDDTIAFLDALVAQGRTGVLENLRENVEICFYSGERVEAKVFEIVGQCDPEYCI